MSEKCFIIIKFWIEKNLDKNIFSLNLFFRAEFENDITISWDFQLNLATLRLKHNPRPKRVFSF